VLKQSPNTGKRYAQQQISLSCRNSTEKPLSGG
jgi:hypothetical protein